MPQPKPDSITKRQRESKAALIEQLKKTPIIQIVCEKAGISRATFYRWKRDDSAFSNTVDEAISDGVGLINDMAESQLIAAIRDRNLTGIIFWLKTRHPAFGTKILVHHGITDDVLNDKQLAAVDAILHKVRSSNEQTNITQ